MHRTRVAQDIIIIVESGGVEGGMKPEDFINQVCTKKRDTQFASAESSVYLPVRVPSLKHLCSSTCSIPDQSHGSISFNSGDP